MYASKVITIVIATTSLLVSTSAEYGFVKVKTLATEEVEFCAGFNSLFKPFPHKSLEVPWESWSKIADVYPDLGCTEHKQNYEQKIVVVKRGNCTFAEKASLVQKANGSGVLIVSEELLVPQATEEEYKINITVAIITEEDHGLLLDMQQHSGESVRVWEYQPNVKPLIDPNVVVMWLLAVCTCAAGAWLQGSSVNKQNQLPRPRARSVAENGSGSTDTNQQGENSLDIHLTPVHALIFFCMSSVSILMMYFFYDYLVYVLIVIFVYASTAAVFDLSYSALRRFPCFVRHRIPANFIPCCSARPPILGILLFLGCASFSIVWAIYRKESFAWILQDFLGAAFCIYMIKTIKLPNFKVSVVLLSLFFVYDIFYVFITPLFTKTKESVMVQVATGGSGTSTEEVPLLFKLPKFMLLSLSKCVKVPYSMLGYGDVILPGLHVGFCASWDAQISNTVKFHSYYLAAVCGYAIGMILTFIGVYAMASGQPALLYLVPCCLLSTTLVAVKRKELHDVWNGLKNVTASRSPSNTDNAESHSLLDVGSNLPD